MIVINLFAGPSAGKSTISCGLFYKLKRDHKYKVEYVYEYAKELYYAKENLSGFGPQLKVLAHQFERINNLKGEVDIAIVDSPLLLSSIYYNNLDSFNRLVLDAFNKFNNINFFLERHTWYEKYGRQFSKEESEEIDIIIENHLLKNNIDFEIVNYDEAVEKISNKIYSLNF